MTTKTTVIVAAVAFVAGALVGTYVCGAEDETDTQITTTESTRGIGPCINDCNWPDFCDPVRAHVMLGEIRGWAMTEPPARLNPADQQRIMANVDRSMDPCLVGTRSSKHVCHLQGPTACEELPPIHQKAAQAKQEQDPGQAQQLWASCADDLESFPGGR